MPQGTGPKKARRKAHAKTRPAAGKTRGRRPTLPGTPEARLLEALEQQAATSEILRVISSSPTDAQPVFDAIVRSAERLCGAEFSAVARFADGLLHLVAVNNLSHEEAEAFRQLFPRAPGRGFAMGRAFVDGRPAHVEDVFADSDYDRQTQGLLQRVTGYRTFLGVPILRAGVPVGVIGCARRSVQPFTALQIDLVKTFAEQAVIAIENVRLFQELEQRNRALTGSLEQQTATGEILRVISSSPTDVRPVLDTVSESAARLCEAFDAAIWRRDGDQLLLVAHHGPILQGPVGQFSLPLAGTAAGRSVLEARTVHVADLLADPDEFPDTSENARRTGFRTVLCVPLMREGTAIGTITLPRTEVQLFSESQIALLETFADQAVIAIENVRLFTELEGRNRALTEALDQQTATSEILRVISSSPTDIRPVLDTVAESAARLCDATDAAIFREDGGRLRMVAHHGPIPFGTVGEYTIQLVRGTVLGRTVLDGRTVQVDDLLSASDEFPEGQELARELGHRTTLAVPLLREGVAIGAITIRRTEVRPFTDRQIALLETFADQAVIAIENVRLFTEVQDRNRELTDTLEQQTATGEILRVISGSPTDVQPVFDTIARNARRLCEADSAAVFTYDGELVHLQSLANVGFAGADALRQAYPAPVNDGHATGRAIRQGRPVHIEDAQVDREFNLTGVLGAGVRTVLAVPMLRDGAAVGIIVLHTWTTPRPFSESQIALLQTFADQAVIAIQNVRLFTEVQERNHDLTETLEQQTATGEILRVISSSPTDVQPVFDAIAHSAARLCEAEMCFVFRFDGEILHFVAHHGLGPAALAAAGAAWPAPPTRGSAAGRAILERGVAHIPDAQADPDYTLTALASVATLRGALAVPMMREGQPVGIISVARSQVGHFTARQIALLQTFADQAVIAIQNVRLFKELEVRNHDLIETLEQQTATSEILRVISSSPTDIQPVLDTVAEYAAKVCGAQNSVVWRLEGDHLTRAASHGPIPVGGDHLKVTPGSVTGRAVLEGRAIHAHDLQNDPEFPVGREIAGRTGHRTTLATPMLREGTPIGAILIRRLEVQPFTEKQIALLQTFADQAVIAIENVRLFQELDASTRELTRSVGELQALGEVSQALGSTLDLQAVLATIVGRAVQLSGSYSGIAYEFDEATQIFHARATHQISPDFLDATQAAPLRLGEGAVGRAGVIRQPVEVADVEAEAQLVAPQVRSLLAREGLRSLLAIPLAREDRLLGGLVIIRRERGGFSPEVVALLQTFAAQSVLAIHNAGLFREIQRQKQYADALVETSPVAIATGDLRGVVVGWNPGAERLFGYSAGEAIGHELVDLVATPDNREDVIANSRAALRGERLHAMARRARKDGTLVDVEMSTMPLVVEGAEVGFIAIYHDVTELLRARREAETANEAKSAFLATMSHEIRTPMNAVIGMSGLLLNTRLSEEQRDYAEIIRGSGDTLLTVINDILDFSKIEAGKLELESQPFDLRECVEGALDLVATRAAEKGIDLAYLLGDGVPAAIVGDVTRLRQVLLNLLSNAVKFTERGEVVLSVGARPPGRGSALHELTFSVRDTGIGIPADRLGRLFQSFSQVDASTTRRYGGTGLGLAISQRLTEMMGGRIGVTSEEGVGSDFHFSIRAAATDVPVQIHRDLSGVQPSLRGKRVLVVDDNATNRRIVTAHLDIWGMASRASESPLEALEWVRTGERFDLAILDMHMPEMDGVALARAIRQAPAGATLPLVLFTSLGRREARAEDEGFAAYLHKPIKPSQLFDALVSVLADQPIHVAASRSGSSALDPEMAGRHPLRILLAEDNVVNQKVALRLLAQMGYRADVAANGLEAIEAVERQTYDVVLMDVQMPELDGFEASREINRRWPGDRRPRIVAMTANAMQGDRELCVAAGMDDYVAKPIRVEELIAALERSPAHRSPAVSGAPAAGAEAAAIDPATFERLVVTTGGPFVAELIDTFAEDARELLAALRQTLARTDLDGFRRAAHSLKSTAESLGATELAALAREVEAAARAGSLAEAPARVDRLAEHYERAARALGDLRRDLSA